MPVWTPTPCVLCQVGSSPWRVVGRDPWPPWHLGLDIVTRGKPRVPGPHPSLPSSPPLAAGPHTFRAAVCLGRMFVGPLDRTPALRPAVHSGGFTRAQHPCPPSCSPSRPPELCVQQRTALGGTDTGLRSPPCPRGHQASGGLARALLSPSLSPRGADRPPKAHRAVQDLPSQREDGRCSVKDQRRGPRGPRAPRESVFLLKIRGMAPTRYLAGCRTWSIRLRLEGEGEGEGHTVMSVSQGASSPRRWARGSKRSARQAPREAGTPTEGAGVHATRHGEGRQAAVETHGGAGSVSGVGVHAHAHTYVQQM